MRTSRIGPEHHATHERPRLAHGPSQQRLRLILNPLALATVAFWSGAGCDGGQAGEKPVRTLRPSVLAAGGIDNSVVFGMESPSTWSTTTQGAVIGQSSTHSQGSYALSVWPSNSNGYTPLKSIDLTTLAAVSPTLAVDMMLPSYQPNPNWYGTAQAYIDCPSRNIYSQFLGQVELTGKPLNVWNTISFPLTNGWVTSLLQPGYSDLTITVVLNVQVPTTGIYYVDNLRFVPVSPTDCSGKPNGTSCTDNSACTVGDTCQAGACRPGTAVICVASNECHDVGVCNAQTGQCSNPAKPVGTVCRPAAGLCDIAEVCDGTAAGCPSDSLLPAATVCRASTGSCDPAEVCDGINAACPADVGSSPPATPTDLSATLTATTDSMFASLSWTASVGATSYNVKRAVVSGGPYITIGSTTAPSFEDPRSTDTASTYYVVTAVNGCAESSGSAEASVAFGGSDLPPTVTPPVPTAQIPVTVSPGQAPPGSKGFYPTHDGESFHFTVPIVPSTGQTSEQVLSQIVLPTLAAVGFSGGAAAIAATSPEGIPEPVPSLAGITAQVKQELDNGFVRTSNGLADSCAQDIVLTAKCEYQPTKTCMDDHRLLRPGNLAFIVPASIPVTAGSPGTGVATLRSVGGGSPPDSFKLRYVGDGASSYVFESCLEGCETVSWGPGKVFFPGSIELHLETGDPNAGDTVAVFSNQCGVRAPGAAAAEAATAFMGDSAPTALVEASLQAIHELSFSDFKAALERRAKLFVFNQVDNGTTIESAGLQAHAWEGASVDHLTGRVFRNYSKKNTVILSLADAPTAGVAALSGLLGQNGQVANASPVDGVALVLLPYGTSADGTTILRYAYRMTLPFTWKGATQTTALLWIDAENGAPLQVVQYLANLTVKATLPVLRRDPNGGVTTTTAKVETENGKAVLKRSDLMNRIDYFGDGVFDSTEVSVTTSGGTADFSSIPGITEVAQAECSSGSNKALVQTNFFATVDRAVSQSIALGTYQPFPMSRWSPSVLNTTQWICNAEGTQLTFGVCQGDTDPSCPNHPGWASGIALDNTSIDHEVGHHITARLTDQRPRNWCCTNPPCNPECKMPIVVWRSQFDDIADAWADHLESTNCTSGYAFRNITGLGDSLNCAHHSDRGHSPRLHELDAQLNEASTKDHFPEHRRFSIEGHANMDMPAAMLWQVRSGLRSLDWVGGVSMYGTALANAFRLSATHQLPTDNTSLTQYLVLMGLEEHFLPSFASFIPSLSIWPISIEVTLAASANKVLAGFARGGIFLVPHACIDGDASTTDPTGCPGGDTNADAVIDVSDNVSNDDFLYLGVPVAENDYVTRNGPSPTFNVWTGPNFYFRSSTATAATPDSSKCNKRFKVELSSSSTFKAESTVASDWINVAAGACDGSWTPPEGTVAKLARGSFWFDFLAVIARTKLYYRVTTTDANGGNQRVSTSPGNGLHRMNAPYIIVNFLGTSWL